MRRRDFIGLGLSGAALAMFGPRLAAAAGAGQASTPLPKRDTVRVAFVIGMHANVIDVAGPWEVFQDVTLPGSASPFTLYTVSDSTEVVEMSGGLQVKPNHAFADAPPPHVIVVPALMGTPASNAWLQAASATADVTTSVCTGAFELARAGLLDGLPATTHHEFWDSFEARYPKVQLQRGPRFVDNGRIATAGGLTSGIDLALHIVQRYHGAEVAAATAAYMEHQSDRWQ